jgi:hypothetical protein
MPSAAAAVVFYSGHRSHIYSSPSGGANRISSVETKTALELIEYRPRYDNQGIDCKICIRLSELSAMPSELT